jgi:hypothetical protein
MKHQLLFVKFHPTGYALKEDRFLDQEDASILGKCRMKIEKLMGKY